MFAIDNPFACPNNDDDCNCPSHLHRAGKSVPGCGCWDCTGAYGCEACYYDACTTHIVVR